jgi:Fe-S oxidoreductase
MREQLVDLGSYPQVMDTLQENVGANYNISGDPAEDRLIWSQNLEVVPEGVRGKEQAEVVYFVGCTASFYPMTYVIPQAFVHILEKAGVDFATMGSEEWCCGFPLIIAGMSDATKALITHNVAAVRELGAKTLVAACPSCFHTWEHTYPEVLGEPLGFEVKHTTQFLEELIAEGRIKLGSFDRPVTYHDPCDLGRTSGIYDAPRNVIRAIPGIEFREMAEIREYALCCGGGGDVEMADQDLVAAVAKRRLEQAQATEAQVILSACQQCKRTLTASTRREKVRMRVLDLVELIDRVLVE